MPIVTEEAHCLLSSIKGAMTIELLTFYLMTMEQHIYIVTDCRECHRKGMTLYNGTGVYFQTFCFVFL